MTRALASLFAVLLLAGCVTEYPEGNKPTEPDLREAARTNTQLGTEYARQGNFDLALEKLKRAVEQDPGYAPAQGAIALVYARRGDDSKAESHFRRALSLDSKDSFARNNFAVFLCGRGKVREGEKLLLETARDRQYTAPEAAWTNAGICVRRDDPEKSEQYFREALNANGNYAPALLEMADLAAQKKDWLRVRAFLQRRDRLAPATAQSLLLGLQAERALGDDEAAATLQRRLRSEFPEIPVPSG